MSSQGAKFFDAADDERYALELRAEVLSTISSANEVRCGQLDRLEIGMIVADDGVNGGLDIVHGTETVEVGGNLKETVGWERVNTGHSFSTTVHGRMTLDASRNTELLTGSLNETHHGGEFLAAGMSDNLIAGLGVRTTAPADLWVTGLTGMEEKVATANNDVLMMDVYAIGMEREYGTSLHNMGVASIGGAVYTTMATGFFQLHKIQRGVRNTVAGGDAGDGGNGNAPAGTPAPSGSSAPPDAPTEAPTEAAANADIEASGSAAIDSGMPSGAPKKSARRLDALDPAVAKKVGLLVERRRHRTFGRITAAVRGFMGLDKATQMAEAERARELARVSEATHASHTNLAGIMEDLHTASKTTENGAPTPESRAAFDSALQKADGSADNSAGNPTGNPGDESARHSRKPDADGTGRSTATELPEMPDAADAPGYRPSRPKNPAAPPPAILVHEATAAPPVPTAAPPRAVDDAWGDMIVMRERTDWFYQGSVAETGATPTGLHQRAHTLIANNMAQVEQAYLDLWPTFGEYTQASREAFEVGGELHTPSRFVSGRAPDLIRADAPPAALFEAEPAARLRIRDEYLDAIDNARAAGDEAQARAMAATLADIDAKASAAMDRTLAQATAFTEWRGAPLPPGLDRQKLIDDLTGIIDAAHGKLQNVSDESAFHLAAAETAHYPRMIEHLELGSDPRPYFAEILLDARAAEIPGAPPSPGLRALEMQYQTLGNLMKGATPGNAGEAASLTQGLGAGFTEPLANMQRLQAESYGGAEARSPAGYRLREARGDINVLVRDRVTQANRSHPLIADAQLQRLDGREYLVGMRNVLMRQGDLDGMIELERVIAELDAQAIAIIDQALREADALANPPPLPTGVDPAALDQELLRLQWSADSNADSALEFARQTVAEGRDPRQGIEYQATRLRQNPIEQDAVGTLDEALASLNRLMGQHRGTGDVDLDAVTPGAGTSPASSDLRDLPGSSNVVLGAPNGASIPAHAAAPPQPLLDGVDETLIFDRYSGLVIGQIEPEPAVRGSANPSAGGLINRPAPTTPTNNPARVDATPRAQATNADDALVTIPGSAPPPAREHARPRLNEGGASWRTDSTMPRRRGGNAPNNGGGLDDGGGLDAGSGLDDGGRLDDGGSLDDGSWESLPASTDPQNPSLRPTHGASLPTDNPARFDYPERGGFLDKLESVGQRRSVTYGDDPDYATADQILFRAENQTHEYAEIVLAEALHRYADKVPAGRLEIPPSPGAVAARGGLLRLQEELTRIDEAEAAANVGESIRQLDSDIDSMLDNHLNAAEHFAQNPPTTDSPLSSIHGTDSVDSVDGVDGIDGVDSIDSVPGDQPVPTSTTTSSDGIVITTHPIPDLASFPERPLMPGDNPRISDTARDVQEIRWRSMIDANGETLGTEDLRVGEVWDDTKWHNAVANYLYQTGQVELSRTNRQGELIDWDISPDTILYDDRDEFDLHQRIGRNLETALRQRMETANYRLTVYERRLLEFMAVQPPPPPPAPTPAATAPPRRRFWPFNFWPFQRNAGSATRHEDIYATINRTESASPNAAVVDEAPALDSTIDYDYVSLTHPNDGALAKLKPADSNRANIKPPHVWNLRLVEDRPPGGWIIPMDRHELSEINDGETILNVFDPDGNLLQYGDYQIAVIRGNQSTLLPRVDEDQILAAIRERKLEQATSPRAQQVGDWVRDAPSSSTNGNASGRLIGQDQVSDVIQGIPTTPGDHAAAPGRSNWDRLPVPGETGTEPNAARPNTVAETIAEVHALDPSDVNNPRGNVAVIDAGMEQLDPTHLTAGRQETSPAPGAIDAPQEGVSPPGEQPADLLFTFAANEDGSSGWTLTVPGQDARAILGSIEEGTPVQRLDLPPAKPGRKKRTSPAVQGTQAAADGATAVDGPGIASGQGHLAANEAIARLMPAKPSRAHRQLPYSREQVMAFLARVGEVRADGAGGGSILDEWSYGRAARLDPIDQEMGWRQLDALGRHMDTFPTYEPTEFDLRLAMLMSSHRPSLENVQTRLRLDESFVQWFDALIGWLQLRESQVPPTEFDDLREVDDAASVDGFDGSL